MARRKSKSSWAARSHNTAITARRQRFKSLKVGAGWWPPFSCYPLLPRVNGCVCGQVRHRTRELITSLQATIDSVQSVGVECHAENIPGHQQQEPIQNINSHANHERPLLCLAGEVADKKEQPGNKPVDDEIEDGASAPGLLGQAVHDCSDAESNDKVEIASEDHDAGIDQRESRNPIKPFRSGTNASCGDQSRG